MNPSDISKILHVPRPGATLNHQVGEFLQHRFLDRIIAECRPVTDVHPIVMAMVSLLAFCDDWSVVGLEVIDLVLRNYPLSRVQCPIASRIVSQINEGVPIDVTLRIQLCRSEEPSRMLGTPKRVGSSEPEP